MDTQRLYQNHPANFSRNILFGKYEIGRVLGQGNFAKVYHGRNLITNESVAIKAINKDKVKKQGMMDQITREVSVMRLVHHPNIVELKEVMATKGKVFFILEYVKGGELFAKPENLLLDENGDLKVSDFGLSALPEQLRNDGLLHTQCGTPAYVAPEVLRKKGYDGSKTDIWSCGVILFVLLTGHLPFEDENVMRMYRKVFKAEYELPEGVSMDAKKLISKLLVADPAKRYSIPEIIQCPWFQNGFDSSIAFPIQEPTFNDENPDNNNDELGMVQTKSLPPFYNAFELISSLSHGFNLSSLFERQRKSHSMFTSKCSASTVLAKLKMAAKKLNLRVASTKNFSMRMQGIREGRKGKLEVTAEVFEVAPEVAVIEFSKSAGDTLEYNKFCEDDVRPALKDIVWSWQAITLRQLLSNIIEV
ncbi:Non-specific serine/threonine protein kinase [Quillaja saponaria]|uniref:non-specific serine/threonine protein kinase n=1 Tax=Quillaja saponaria TaxID=32244 RepID=A0AAD7PQ52_QUISA|nr:Non-specific serine/threonine protein kinase [Quillaja saponaria]